MTNTSPILIQKNILFSKYIFLKEYIEVNFVKNYESILVACVVYASLLIIPNHQLNDGDTLWHIILGQEILQSLHLPIQDHFSSIFSGQSYWTNSWLSDVLLASAYNLSGFSGVVILSTLSISLTFYLLHKTFLIYMPSIISLMLSCWVFLLISPHILSRPHVLVFPLIVLWTNSLLESEKTGFPPSLKSYITLFFWVNMHGSFLLAYFLAAPIFLFSLLRKKSDEKKIFLSWLVFFIGMVAITICGPYGIRPATTALSVIGVGSLLNNIQEWMPQSFEKIGLYEVNLLVLIAILSYGRVQLSLCRIIILISLLHMSLAHVRNADYFAIIGSLLIAEPASYSISKSYYLLNIKKYSPLLCIIVLIQTFHLLLFKPVYPTINAYPKEAINAAKTNKLEGNVLNDYSFSGALIFENIKVLIDSRTEFYSPEFFKQYLSIINGSDNKGLNDYLNRYSIKWAILNSNTQVIEAMNKLSDWQEIYKDSVATVYLKLHQDSSNSEIVTTR